MTLPMQCYVYRSLSKQQTYLFLPDEGDFSRVPETLLRLFGTAEFSFVFELTEGKQLMQGDAQQIAQHLSDNGFFLQLPPGDAKLWQ